jgi:hypothetical protein
VADYVGEFEERIAALGANLLLADYRGYGLSSGTPELAAMLDDVALLVEAAGVDLARLQAAVGRALDQRHKLAAFRGRTLIMHARGDDLVPVSHAERLHAWANAPKQLLVLPHGDHNSVLAAKSAAYFAAVGQFIAER